MQSHDAVIIGAGIIGVSLALELQKRGLRVLVLEQGMPGRAATFAGAGMLAAQEVDSPLALRELALASARLYPGFVKELECHSGLSIDFRRDGTICFLDRDDPTARPRGRTLSPDELRALEPAVFPSSNAYFLEEDSVDPRSLFPALLHSAVSAGVEIKSRTKVLELVVSSGVVSGVRTTLGPFSSAIVVNCAGAWAAQISGADIPALPVKGHMFSVKPSSPGWLRHVVRSKDVYLVPRSDGRCLIGSTVERVGFDQNVDSGVIQTLHALAAALVPSVAPLPVTEAWTGLRPGSPDDLPIIGETGIKNYFAATGHYRNGILLAPVTAKVMADLVLGNDPKFDISRFSPARFR
ncbi:MAG TPA: glycine oxidase ThiO [Terriglobales bacterium]|nr:glycine oxidase ThiO [Terriglobales bacterium]